MTYFEVYCTCDGVDHCAQDGGRLNELFKDVGLCCQGKAVVQHFLQQLINHYHIVLDGSLRTYPEIVLITKNTSSMYTLVSKRWPGKGARKMRIQEEYEETEGRPGMCRRLCAGTR